MKDTDKIPVDRFTNHRSTTALTLARSDFSRDGMPASILIFLHVSELYRLINIGEIS
ncbi:hypothetical protein [Leptolyngbya iicbica]|uniref:Uncharacterized protein n=1 Tax=Lyngbya confervoides BDU141951 TaxID=1574623 RepID=A0A8T6QNY0_9CYAN|nr:hypothetical protein [Leptolyngbya sp. LK]